MAHIAQAPATFAPFAAVRTLIASVQDMMQRRAAYNRVFTELSALNDRELNDLGLSRADFHNIAADAAAKL